MERERPQHIKRARALAFCLAPYVILLGEVLAFHRHVLFDSSRYAIPWDLRYYHFPQAFFIARQFQAGEWPLWNPWVYCGMPWYAKIDSQLFYPPTTLAIVISNWFGGRRLWYFLELQVIAHVWLAGIFIYLLARHLGLGRASSLIGATIYALGAFFATQTQHVGAVDAAAWLPLAWLGIALLARAFSWPRLALLAIALAMVILAGYPPAGFPILFSCGLLALLAALQQRRWALLMQAALAAAWSAALAALPLLPSLELLPLSHAGQRSSWMLSAKGIPPAALLTLVHPNYLGAFQFDSARYDLPWDVTFTYLYCGIPALIFFVAAVLLCRTAPTYMYAVVTVLCGFGMLGGYTAIGRLIYPVLPRIVKAGAWAEFAMCPFVLGLAMTAAFGAERLLCRRRQWLKAAVIAAVAGDLTLASSGRPFNLADRRLEPAIGHDHFEQFADVPGRMRSLVEEAAPPWRIDLIDGSPLWHNGAMLLEVPSATGDDPLALLRVLNVRALFSEQAYWVRNNQVIDPSSPVLDFLNVRYLLSQREMDPDQLHRSGLRRVADLQGQVIYENPEAMPRFFLVGRVVPVRHAKEAIERLKTADLRREAVVEGAEANWRLAHGGTVRLLRYEANDVLLEVEAPGGAYLVTSETYYPGWRAWVGGVEQPLWITNGAFRGMPVPPGRHRVRMSFRPALLRRSAAIAVVAWLLVFAALLPAVTSACRLCSQQPARRT